MLALARAFSLIDTDEDAETALLAAATQEKNVIRTARQPANLEQVAFNLRDRMSHGQLAHHQRAGKDPVFGKEAPCPMRSAGSIQHPDLPMTLMTLAGFAMDGMTQRRRLALPVGSVGGLERLAVPSPAGACKISAAEHGRALRAFHLAAARADRLPFVTYRHALHGAPRMV